MRSGVIQLVLAVVIAGLGWAAARADSAAVAERNVTFICTSDPHYKGSLHAERNSWDRESIDQMNAITSISWPAESGGGAIDRPRGVLVLGDCIDDGDKKIDGRSLSQEQYGYFVRDMGFDGTDGVLKYPVFEGWGNHDGPPEGQEKNGFSFQAHLKQRNALRKEKGMISNVSANGLHYSWDWDDIHFVHLNIYPADQQREKIHYSAVWHNPQQALQFLKDDLAKQVGTSGRPVVLMSHCGFDTDWWSPYDWREVYNAAKAYHVILYLYGHSGTGIREWAPPGEEKKWQCINDGNMTVGFMVIQIKGDRIRCGYRTRPTAKYSMTAAGLEAREWDGTWGWKWPLVRTMSPVPATEPATAPSARP